jgi:hypothetical protein
VVDKRALYGVGSDVGRQVAFFEASLNPPWDNESKIAMGILNRRVGLRERMLRSERLRGGSKLLDETRLSQRLSLAFKEF